MLADAESSTVPQSGEGSSEVGSEMLGDKYLKRRGSMWSELPIDMNMPGAGGVAPPRRLSLSPEMDVSLLHILQIFALC